MCRTALDGCLYNKDYAMRSCIETRWCITPKKWWNLLLKSYNVYKVIFSQFEYVSQFFSVLFEIDRLLELFERNRLYDLHKTLKKAVLGKLNKQNEDNWDFIKEFMTKIQRSKRWYTYLWLKYVPRKVFLLDRCIIILLPDVVAFAQTKVLNT